MPRSTQKRPSKAARGRARGRVGAGRKSPASNDGSKGQDDVFAELLSDEDSRKTPAPRGRLKEPDSIFWDFWS